MTRLIYKLKERIVQLQTIVCDAEKDGTLSLIEHDSIKLEIFMELLGMIDISADLPPACKFNMPDTSQGEIF